MGDATVDALVKRHRLEQRDLQARITQKKKNATKKTRKGINDECATLERDLQDRHAAERAALHLHDGQLNEIASGNIQDLDFNIETRAELDNVIMNTTTCSSDDIESSQRAAPADIAQAKKPNRQKARLARRAAYQESIVAQAENEATQIPDLRSEERDTMVRELRSRGLTEKEVRSDGHCLFAAIADQLNSRNIPTHEGNTLDYKSIRRAAAKFIEDHPEDFEAFLEEPLQSYVTKIRETGEWGGQLEISALARCYSIVINVLQGDGRVEKIDPGMDGPLEEVWLAYYRHSFGLGEHYNSLHHTI